MANTRGARGQYREGLRRAFSTGRDFAANETFRREPRALFPHVLRGLWTNENPCKSCCFALSPLGWSALGNAAMLDPRFSRPEGHGRQRGEPARADSSIALG